MIYKVAYQQSNDTDKAEQQMITAFVSLHQKIRYIEDELICPWLVNTLSRNMEKSAG